MSVGQRLKEAREAAGLSQRKLSGSKYTGSYVCQIESGKTTPSLKALHYFAVRLRKPMSFFYVENEELPVEAKEAALEILGKKAEILLQRGERGKASKAIEEASQYFDNASNQRAEALCARASAALHAEKGLYDKAEQELKKADALFHEATEVEELVANKIMQAKIFMEQARLAEAENATKEAESLLGELEFPDYHDFAQVWHIRAAIMEKEARHEDAQDALEKALECAGKARSAYLDIERLVRKSDHLRGLGELDKAKEAIYQASNVLRMANASKVHGKTLLELGASYHSSGRDKEAESCVEEAVGQLSVNGEEEDLANALLEAARLYLEIGEVGKAKERGAKAITLAERSKSMPLKGKALEVLGDIATSDRKWEQAKTHYFEALDIFKKEGSPMSSSSILQKLSQLLLESGDTGKANDFLREALTSLRSIEV